MENIDCRNDKIDVDKEARILSEAAGKYFYPADEQESGSGFVAMNNEIAKLCGENLKLVVAGAQRLHEEALQAQEQARRDIVKATHGTDADLDRARKNLNNKDVALRHAPDFEIVYENEEVSGVLVHSGRRRYLVKK